MPRFTYLAIRARGLGSKTKRRLRAHAHSILQLLRRALHDALADAEAFALRGSSLLLKRQALDALLKRGRLVNSTDVYTGNVDLVGVKAAWWGMNGTCCVAVAASAR